MKHKILIFAFLCAAFSLIAAGVLAASYDYTPMEKIPGTTESISAFPDYIKAIYKFAIWAVGIAALFMISVGGFMYFTAAGNTSKLDKAKTVIKDSIWGLVAALSAYLILYVINPDLVNVSLESLSNLSQDSSVSSSSSSSSSSPGSFNMPSGQLAITTPGLNEGTAGINYSQTIQAEGGSHNYTISVSGLPNGLTFNSTNNTIIGTPAQAGSSQAIITVNDGTNDPVEKKFNLNVREEDYAGNNGSNNQSDSAELSRNPLSISVTEGGNVSNRTILVTDNLGNFLAFQIVGINGDWISSPKAGDTGNKTLNVSFNTTSLSAGNHNGSVAIKPDGFNNLTLNVLLTVLSGEEEGSGGGNLPECQCGVDLFPGYDNYCSMCGPCKQNEGPCKSNDECSGGLVCDQRHGYNFCVTPKVAGENPGWRCPYAVGDPMFCIICRRDPTVSGSSPTSLCMEGEGWCNNWSQCMSHLEGGLDCPLESGPNYHTCTRTKGPGITCRAE